MSQSILLHTHCAAQGEAIISIPPEAILNVGGWQMVDSYTEVAALILAELKNPHSRFKPYMDIMPAPNEVLCLCNLQEEYAAMLPQGHWVSQHARWGSGPGSRPYIVLDVTCYMCCMQGAACAACDACKVLCLSDLPRTKRPAAHTDPTSCTACVPPCTCCCRQRSMYSNLQPIKFNIMYCL